MQVLKMSAGDGWHPQAADAGRASEQMLDFAALMFGKQAAQIKRGADQVYPESESPEAAARDTFVRSASKDAPTVAIIGEGFNLSQFRKRATNEQLPKASPSQLPAAAASVSANLPAKAPKAAPPASASGTFSGTGPSPDFSALMANSKPPEAGTHDRGSGIFQPLRASSPPSAQVPPERVSKVDALAMNAPGPERRGSFQISSPAIGEASPAPYLAPAPPDIPVNAYAALPPEYAMMPEGAVPISVGPSPQDHELAAMKADLDELLHQKVLSEDQVGRLQNEVLVSQKRAQELEAQLEDAEKRVAAGKQALVALTERIDDLQRSTANSNSERLGRLDAELAQVRTRAMELESMNSVLQREVGALESALKEQQKGTSVNEKLDELQSADVRNRAKLSELLRQLAKTEVLLQSEQTRAASAEARVAELSKELAEKNGLLAKAAREEKELRDTSAQMLYELEIKNESLANQLEQLERDSAAKAKEWAQLEDVEKRLAAASSEREALLVEQRNNQALLADAEAREAALTQLVAQLEERVREVGEMPVTDPQYQAGSGADSVEAFIRSTSRPMGSRSNSRARPSATSRREDHGPLHVIVMPVRHVMGAVGKVFGVMVRPRTLVLVGGATALWLAKEKGLLDDHSSDSEDSATRF